MPVESHWYDDTTQIILTRYVGMWDLDEARKRDEEMHKLLEAVSGRFDIMLDVSKSSYAPPAGVLSAWREASEALHNKFPNWGLTVFIAGDNKLIGTYVEEGWKISDVIQQHFRLAKSVKEAYALILEERAKDNEQSAEA